MEKSFTINLSSDTDGFLEYECPFCEQKFRLATNEFQGSGDYAELYCPYCKLKSSSENFYTTEGIQYIEKCKEIIAENLTFETIKNATKNNKFFKLTTKHKKRGLPNPPILEESNMTNKKCVECEHEFKILNGHISTCCPYCSKE